MATQVLDGTLGDQANAGSWTRGGFYLTLARDRGLPGASAFGASSVDGSL
jgi:hypothetical protein